ncbi:hypothetical protein JCM10212_003660 [Sporobolomyces blumeae]
MSYAGGGFLASQGSNGSPSGGGRKSGSQALRPVTIHQVRTAEQSFTDSEFMIDGAEVKEITLVACIRSVTRTTTQATFLVEDGTGQMDCRMWVESSDGGDEGDPRLAALENNRYVRIIGSIKTFSDKRHINAQRVRPIEDFNEISFHLVECAYVHKYTTLGPPGGGNTAMVTDRPYDNAGNPYASDAHGGGMGGAGDGIPTDLPSGQRAVLKFVKEQSALGDSGGEGVHIQAIVRSLGFGEAKVRDLIQTLETEGHLYSTIDEDHFAMT